MKAVCYENPGPPDVLTYTELADPIPGMGEVLIQVEAVSVNPIDTYIRSGAVTMPRPQPTIPGCDLAGRIIAVGQNVKRFRVGDRVWGSNQGLLGRQGTFAELACVHEDWLYPLPQGVTAEAAAASALVGITAHLGLFRCAKLQQGEVVFVNGGTGGVGSMVVQMSRAIGAIPITTVGSAEKAELARKLGAVHVINYRSEDVVDRIRAITQGQGVHVWYETLREPDFVRTVDLLAFRGRMIVMAGRQAQPIFPVGPFYTKDLTLYGFAMFRASPEEQRVCADDMNRWLQEGKLQPVIGVTLPLKEAAAAHRLQEENTIGKAGTLTGKIVLKP
jgi:NADPH2:quinone reductase